MTAKRTSKKPSPKFHVGDFVCFPGMLVFGRVSFVHAYDAHLGDHRYKVEDQDGGPRKTYNGKSLVRVPKATAKRLLRPF